MATGPRFVPNSAGMAQLLSSQPMGTAMLAAADMLLPDVRNTTPRNTGALAASWRTEAAQSMVRTRAGATLRAGARITTDQDYGPGVEFGHAGASIRGHAGFQYVVPGSHVLGALASTRAARTARKGAR